MQERQREYDFPPGHPARHDYDPGSPEAAEWARRNVAPLGERDFPVDHPKAADTPGNQNVVSWQAGVDPFNPHREAHTGRTPEQAEGVRALTETASKAAAESPVLQPVDGVSVAAALDRKRKELGRDILTAAEHSEVLAEFHSAPREGQDQAAIQRAIEAQHQALAYVMNRGYSRTAALEVVATEGADRLLAQRDAEAEAAKSSAT
jgi:hypothetical protein